VRVVVANEYAFKERVRNERELNLGTDRTLMGISLSTRGESLNVIDFGGVGGHHYVIAKATLPSSTGIRWNVVEMSAMAEEAIGLASQELEFVDDIENVARDIGSVDLVFAGGALRYCPAPLVTLAQLLSVGAPNVFGYPDRPE
jgi:putative methyltransferase (TIGR04325 family)